MGRMRKDWSEADHLERRRLMRKPELTPVERLLLRRSNGRFRRFLRLRFFPVLKGQPMGRWEREALRAMRPGSSERVE